MCVYVWVCVCVCVSHENNKEILMSIKENIAKIDYEYIHS